MAGATRLAIALLSASLVLAACGEDDLEFPGQVPDATNTPGPTATPTSDTTPTVTPTPEEP